MKFQIPFSISPLDKLKKRASPFKKFFKQKSKSKLSTYLANSNVEITREEYLAICLRSFIAVAIVTFIISSTALFFFQVSYSIPVALGISILFSIFTFIIRVSYPRVYSARRQREIEANLIPALENILVQLNSGVPLYTIMINISSEDYGALSEEFKKAVARINAGFPQIEVLDDLGERNPSPFFRRAVWQISNGMRAGSDISVVIKDSINALNEEQLIQIQNYGNKLNPLIMFYMLLSVILPALAITFLTVITSLINLSKTSTSFIFIALFFFVVLAQVMFLGMIRSIRPSLL